MKTFTILLLSLSPVVIPPLEAQEFDRDRAWIVESTVFDPFFVDSTIPLRQALDDRRIDDESHLMVLELGAARLALATEQMVYHHAAQGEIAGEPWMVSF